MDELMRTLKTAEILAKSKRRLKKSQRQI